MAYSLKTCSNAHLICCFVFFFFCLLACLLVSWETIFCFLLLLLKFNLNCSGFNPRRLFWIRKSLFVSLSLLLLLLLSSALLNVSNRSRVLTKILFLRQNLSRENPVPNAEQAFDQKHRHQIRLEFFCSLFLQHQNRISNFSAIWMLLTYFTHSTHMRTLWRREKKTGNLNPKWKEQDEMRADDLPMKE